MTRNYQIKFLNYSEFSKKVDKPTLAVICSAHRLKAKVYSFLHTIFLHRKDRDTLMISLSLFFYACSFQTRSAAGRYSGKGFGVE